MAKGAPVQTDWYETPQLYDIVFDADTRTEADFLEALHRRHSRTRGRRSLELACGSGRLVRELASRGWNAAGFDIQPAMLAYARRRLRRAGTEAELWRDSMQSFRAPRARFDLVHCLVSSFKYLLTEEDALACLRRVAAALKPGGIFVLGLHLTDPANRRPLHERWVAERGGIRVVCNTRTWPPADGSRLESMRTRLRVARRDGSLHEQETRWQARSYTAAQLRQLLAKCGAFETLACHDFRHDPGETRAFDDEYPDLVLVLGRRQGRSGGPKGDWRNASGCD